MEGAGQAELRRDEPGLARLVRDGQVLLEIRAEALDGPGFEALLARFEAALRPAAPARAVVTYREGLLAGVQAETALDLVFVEEDPHDVPPVQVRRRRVAPDAEAVRAAIAAAEARTARRG